MKSALPKLTMMQGPTIYDAVVDLVKRQHKCSVTFIERNIGVGKAIAATTIARMEREGVVSPMRSNGTREVLK